MSMRPAVAVTVTAVILAAALGVQGPAPAAAECTNPSRWPPFTTYAASSPDVIMGTVTWSALPDAYASWFRLTVDEVVRGPRTVGSSIGFYRLRSGAPEPTCPGETVLYVQAGDRLAIAFDAPYPGQARRITTVAFVRPSGRDRLPRVERLSAPRVRRAAGVAQDPSSSRARTSPRPSVPVASSQPRDQMDLDGIECRDLQGEPRSAVATTGALARFCDPARAPATLHGALRYAQGRPDYAGAVFPDGERRMEVWFTSDPAPHTAALKTLLPPDTDLVVREAEWTWRQLLALQDHVTRNLQRLLRDDMPVTTVRIDTRRNRVVIGIDGPAPDQEQVLMALGPGRIGLSAEPREAMIEELTVGAHDETGSPVTFIGGASLVHGVRPASAHELGPASVPIEGVWTEAISPRRTVVGWAGHDCGAIVLLVDGSNADVIDADVGDTPCTEAGAPAGVMVRLRRRVGLRGKPEQERASTAPTTEWGPMAVVHDTERAGLDAGLGPGTLTIGETCTTLEVDGRATTLVWRDWQAAWDAHDRAIRIEDDRGQELELVTGDHLMLGGYAPWMEGAGGPPAPPWLVKPDPGCPALLFLVHSVTRR